MVGVRTRQCCLADLGISVMAVNLVFMVQMSIQSVRCHIHLFDWLGSGWCLGLK